MGKKSIIVLSQSINQPRVINRVKSLSEKYNNVEVYTFKRNKYDTKNYKKILGNDISINIIGELKDGEYSNRIFLYFKLIFKLLQTNFFKKNHIYSFGLDCGLISMIFFAKIKFYEISDIKWLYNKGFSKNILKRLDYFICNYSYKVYFTSEGFYKYYYNFLNIKKVEIIENKLNTYGVVTPIEKLYDNRISIVYVGALRYKNIMESVLEIISTKQNIELNFYGEGSKEINNLINRYSSKFKNIHFHGKFKNPDDLEKIYSKANINFVCYDNQLENEKVALPNKYYESGYFNIPILCSRNTFLSELVDKNDMGWAIDIDKKSLIDFFENISIGEILKKHQNIKSLDKNQFYNANNQK